MIKKYIGYTTVILLGMATILCGWYYYSSYSLIPTYKQMLTTMVDKRVQEINQYLIQQEKNATALAHEKSIINKNFNTFHSVCTTHQTTMGFKNIILIDKTGTIIYTTSAKNIVGISLTDPAHASASLSSSYQRASMCLTSDISHFNFNNLLGEPALFITVPILHHNKFIGCLAYQLNPDQLYLITNQYIGLEKTGEVVLATREEMNAIFIAPTRNDPDLAFKKRALSVEQPISIQPSILGNTGSGTAVDYRGKKVVGAWSFIPKLDWGMIIKIDMEELLQSTQTLYKMLLLLLTIFIITCLAYLYLHRTRVHAIIIHHHKKGYPLFILLLIFGALALKNSLLCLKERASTINQAKQKAIRDCSDNADSIEGMLSKIAFVGQSMADDLRTGYLLKNDITTRIQRDSKEYPIIKHITVLFAPYMYDKATHVYAQTTEQLNITPNLYKTNWYQQAVEKKSAWIVNDTTGIYARAFYDEQDNLQGVIAITFELTPLIERAEYSGIGQTGYSLIMSDDGTFIFHPISSLVQSKTTLLQYAQLRGNEELAVIAQHVIEKKPYLNSYISENTHERFWIYTHPIPVNNWIVGSIFPEDEIELPAEIIRHYCFWIIIWTTITLLLLSALCWFYNVWSLTLYACAIIIIFASALIATWRIIQLTTTINRESRTIITDQSNLSKFLNDINEESARKHEGAPINIPCGILLSSLSTAGHNSITLSGYIWNKYNPQMHKNITRAIDITQATRMTFGNPITVASDTGEETTTWNIQGTMYQEQNYELYPFDQQQIRIILEHKDLEKNIILTPDLVSYKKISPEATPGLDKDFTLPGFTIQQTFFEYHKINPTTSFGFKEYGKVTDNYQFVFNAIITRNLSNPFILYLLPLLVILFSLFTTLLITERRTSPLSILGGYTGLFFALIVLQRSLREQHPAGTALYMEYAFFYTYITIILLIIHTILVYYYKSWKVYQDRSFYYMKILFWPFQLLSWLITTLIIFY